VRRASFRELTGTASATFQLFDGTGTNGVLLDSIALSPGQSTRDPYKCWEYPYESSLYLNVLAGSFEGCIVVQYLGPGVPELEEVLAITLSDLEAAATAAAVAAGA
jgi:hypothetical protein